MSSLDNEPGGADHEDYQRDDLSGIVFDVSGSQVHVRFLNYNSMNCQLVIRADGSLAIDPSGIPKPRTPQIEASPTPGPEGAYESTAEEFDDELHSPRKELEE